jgi:hypothetical protein
VWLLRAIVLTAPAIHVAIVSHETK